MEHHPYYDGRGFRSCLDEAIRAWEEGKRQNNMGVSSAIVEYADFKRKLRKYSQRRKKLKRFMDQSESEKSFLAEDVMAILRGSGCNSNTSSRRKSLSPNSSSQPGCYVPMGGGGSDEGDNPCQDLSGIWKPPKEYFNRRRVLREVSKLEREGVEELLADETLKISEVYRSTMKSLDCRFLEWRTRLWYEHDRSELVAKPTTTITVAAAAVVGSGNYSSTTKSNATSDHNYLKNNPMTRSMIRQTIELGRALLDLEAVCLLNILVVRQSLIRYDAFARSFEGTPLMEFYLKTVLLSKNPHTGNNTPNLYYHELRQILLHKEILALSLHFSQQLEWLCQEIRVSELQTRSILDDRNDGDDEDNHLHDNSIVVGKTNTWLGMNALLKAVGEQFRKDRKTLRRIFLSSTESPEKVASTTPATGKSSAFSTLAEHFMKAFGKHVLFGTSMEDQFGWYLDSTRTRGRNLTKEMKDLADWKLQSQKLWSLSRGGMLEADMDPKLDILMDLGTCGTGEALLEGLECNDFVKCGNRDDASFTESEGTETSHTNNELGDLAATISKQQKFNLFLALTGGFLYCMNYYIVEPSSTMYVNALGAQDYEGAILIGMMPIAAFLSAILYSIWTNTVFREPFLISCTLMVTGNVIYSAAFNYKSLPMALIGRFLTGLGGPKMIVRRYMADTTSVSIRTSVNAGFGMVVAAGSALGPGCAILLSNFEFILPLPGGRELWFNSMTGPGWFMATLWGFFSVALFWGFQEQDRIGLAEKFEQDQKERMNEKLLARREVEDHKAGGSRNTNRIEESIPEDISRGSDRLEEGIAIETSIRRITSVASSVRSARSSSFKVGSPKSECSVSYKSAIKPSSSHLKSARSVGDESLRTILTAKSSMSIVSENYLEKDIVSANQPSKSLSDELRNVYSQLLLPVRICMGLLFAKVFVIETLVSCTSVLSKNRYGWNIHQVGLLGSANVFFVIPLSIVVGKLSLQYQDRYLMVCLLAVGMAGLCFLVDGTDLVDTSQMPRTYNWNLFWSVGPIQYVMGYFITYLSIQSFEGIIGSALSKLIPTTLAQGTFNSGLIATLVDTFGRSCGDLFISLMGFWNIRQLMNLLFVPGVMILATCLIIIRKYYDLLAV